MRRFPDQPFLAAVRALACGLLTVALVAGCGSEPAPAPTPDPPDTPRRLVVELVSVRSSNTEDNLGDDEFYVVAGSSATDAVSANPSGNPWGNVSQVIDVSGDDEWVDFREGRILYGGETPGTNVVHIGLAAYDEDTAKDWSQWASWVTDLAAGLARAGTGNGWVKAAALVVGVIATILSMDDDDELGRDDLVIPVNGAPREERLWTIDHDGGALGSSYHYEVKILITRG